MSEEQARHDTHPPVTGHAEAAAPRERRSMRLAPRTRMTMAAVVLIFLGWQLLDTRNELRTLREDMARRAGEESVGLRDARQLARNGQESALALQGRVGALEDRVNDSEAQQVALERLYQDLSRNRDERLLQETEQAVAIAAQQLQLAGNVPAALAALQAADARLVAGAQARFVPLRRSLTQDIERLKALPLADVTGMSLQLEAMLARIDTLPFAFERTPPAQGDAGQPVQAPAPSGWRSLLGDLWGEFRSLLRIERLDTADASLVSPSQTRYLRENLRLRLLSARLALMQRDGRVFAEDIKQARQLLSQHFDQNARAVSAVAEELRQMGAARLAVELPGLAESEAALRRLRQGR